MTHAAAWMLCLAGFAALAFGVSRQQEELFGRELRPAATAMWRGIGAMLLVTGLVVLARAFGWGLGFVMFSGHTSLAAGAVYLALVACRRWRGVA